MTRKIVTIVGARPQFIKAAAVSRLIRADYAGRLDEVIVHTGQHYDYNMSQVFFEELDIPTPKYNLNIAGGTHGAMTGKMLQAIEGTLLGEKPDLVLTYGDTNSTLAGALAAVKLHIPVAHVEAGLRSFNIRMPEEVNRILVDRVSSLLLCPTVSAVGNLHKEGVFSGVLNAGDVMYDVSEYYRNKLVERDGVIERIGVMPGRYVLATCHRAENTDNLNRLSEICHGLAEVAEHMAVVFPLHPRTRDLLFKSGLMPLLSRTKILEPLPFLDMLALQQKARTIITDSGGIQKEAFFHKVPCVTIRDETEWVETVELRWNQLVGASRSRISVAALTAAPGLSEVFPYGDGNAARHTLEAIIGCL